MTEVPSLISPRIRFHKKRLEQGSMPVVGSSWIQHHNNILYYIYIIHNNDNLNFLNKLRQHFFSERIIDIKSRSINSRTGKAEYL